MVRAFVVRCYDACMHRRLGLSSRKSRRQPSQRSTTHAYIQYGVHFGILVLVIYRYVIVLVQMSSIARASAS